MLFFCAALILYLGILAIKTDRRRCLLVPYCDGKRLDRCRVLVVKSWANRRVGLANHLQLPRSFALFISNTRSVHTKGMLMPIDVVIIDKHMTVTAVLSSIGPGRCLRFRGRRHVLEMRAGAADCWKLRPGMKLELADA